MVSRALMFLGLSAIGLAVRALNYPTIFTPTGVHLPFAGDAYYHLRRIWFSVARFPEILPFDSYVGFPKGAQIHWPSAFDWTIAALIRPFVDPTDQASVEALAVWAPALLGAATTGLIGLFAARLFGLAAGWCAGLIYSVLPISYVFSQLGNIDHHIAVAFLTTGMFWIATEIVAQGESTARGRAAFLARAAGCGAAAGLPMVVVLSVWPGALLHVVLLQAALGAWWLWARTRVEARRRAVVVAASQTAAAVCIAPAALGNTWDQYGSWSPLVLSNFQPVYFACVGLTVALGQLVHERTRWGDSVPRRVLSSAALAFAGAGIALWALPPLRGAIHFAGGWFAAGEDIYGEIFEMQPILAVHGRFDPGFALERFGPAFFVFPIVWLLTAVRARRERDVTRSVVLWWAFGFTALTLRQWRFGTSLAPVYSILTGGLLASWLLELRSRFHRRCRRAATESLLVAILVVWTGAELRDAYRTDVQLSRAALADEAVRIFGPLAPVKRLSDIAARWIARNTPPTSGYLDPSQPPEYAVLTSWSTGHLVRYRSERPTVQDNFGPCAGRASFELARDYYASRDEDDAIRILEDLGVRYVIGGREGTGWGPKPAPDSMAARLAIGYGSRFDSRAGGFVPGLARHRLIFHVHTVPNPPSGLRVRVPPPNRDLGVWEIVRGARIEGRADPGSEVRVALRLFFTSRATHLYERRAVADVDGRYDLIIPYPTDARVSPAVRTASAYRVRSGDVVRLLQVSEEEVQAGARISGPDLRREAADAA